MPCIKHEDSALVNSGVRWWREVIANLGRNLCATTGTRPPPGAAGSDPPMMLGSSKIPLLANVAAPGSGRTRPGVQNCAPIGQDNH
jgi:hypothetical protein